MSDAQHDFVPRRSCITHLLSEEWVTELMDGGETDEMVFLDYVKAFDSGNHRMLGLKLRAYGINPMVVDWVQAFLSNRHFKVRVNGQVSDCRSAGSGVPRGSVLGPTLFLLFVNDLPDVLEGRVLLFADDAKLIALRSDFNILQRNFRAAWGWSEVWALPLYAAQCDHLQIG